MRRDEIVRVIEAYREEIDRFGVRSLLIFGSVARDQAGDDSDLDVLVEFDPAPDFDRFMGLKLFLEDLVGRRVDLATSRALRPGLRPIVERAAIRVA